jgi:uncharacterized protein
MAEYDGFKKTLISFADGEFPVYCFDGPSDHLKGDVFFLHGAGKADGPRMFPLCSRLAKEGYRCVTFDFHGHGESTLPLDKTSLQSRKAQALFVVENFSSSSKRAIVAFSMSGQTAVEVAEVKQFDNLVLFAPAMYSSRASEVKFGPEFTEILRQEGSWKDSAVPTILAALGCKINVFSGESDAVIPHDIIREYATCEIGSFRRQLSFIRGEGHMVSGRTNESPDFADKVAKAIVDNLDF